MITTRSADAELLKRVGVVQMEAGSAVARTSSRAARPCAADTAPPRYPHIREEASRSGLLGPRGRPRAWRTGGKGRYCSSAIVHAWYCSMVLFMREKRLGLALGAPLPLAIIAPGRSLRWAPLGPHLGRPFWA